MIPATRNEALAVLAEICELPPDVRFGQLLAHLGFLGEDQTGQSQWNIDDESFLTVLYHHRAELVSRIQDMPSQALQPTGPAPTVGPAKTAT